MNEPLDLLSTNKIVENNSVNSAEQSAEGSAGRTVQGTGGATPSQKGSAITRVLDILELVATSSRPISATELSDNLEIPKATIHRLCSTLENHGLLQSKMNGRGMLPGHRFHTIAVGVLASSPFRAERHAILSKLSLDIGETCNISIPDGSEMIYFHRAETHWPVRVQLQVGSRVPAHTTASGKMYLSSLPAAKRQRILANSDIRQHTINTVQDLGVLEKELELTRKRGFAVDNEEYIDGMVALAIAVTDHQKRLYATLSFHAPAMRVPFAALESHLPKLRLAAEQLCELLEE